MLDRYKHAVLGGTFDHLHNGHKRILDFAFHQAEMVTIGVTSRKMAESKFPAKNIESFEVRKASLQMYIEDNNWQKRAEIIQIHDIFGTTLKSHDFDSIVVTSKTYQNAISVNSMRLKNKLRKLKILSVPLLMDERKKTISSTNIRSGIINRNGTSYLNLFSNSRQLNLPPRLRELLRKPLGIIVEGDEVYSSMTAKKAISIIKRHHPILVVTVGDIVSNTLIEENFLPDVAILDNRSRRREIKINQTKIKNTIFNPPGRIRREAVKKIHKAIQSVLLKNKKFTIQIKGEEDLLALPAVLLAPLNSIVAYGDRNLGIILVFVNEEVKKKVVEIIGRFE